MSHHSGFLTPSVRSHRVSMGTSTLIFCVTLPSGCFACAAANETSQWPSGGTVWIYKLACTPLEGNILVWTIVCAFTPVGNLLNSMAIPHDAPWKRGPPKLDPD